ncbi:hypothetical protein [Streptacidiphilus jiangxiensis]|uniref:Extracellular repeat, HAF family n=1 Tax=Streptacidiphilus jiangxiensis TaxID=235985 RepID=A0A1H7WUR8_STRJI|nr:hypothetical protein [Streptacidiphilus jiangxiensis]SEM24649.1 hypothetical protein SAMN05414137_121126 [Streptacidiphilus jiangxiensis]
MRLRSRAWILTSASLLAAGLGISAGSADAADTAGAVGAAGAASGQYSVQDLGTLGGSHSEATAIDRTTVVGDSLTDGDAAEHAFAYDLRRHTMTDLGTLGGASSWATGVAGEYVVGQSDVVGGGATHGFAYDLRTRRMVDLGTLGGSTTTVAGLSGDTVVGTSSLPGDTVSHAFAYNLRTATMTDLGSLAGPSGDSTAAAVNGGIVVGSSSLPATPAATRHGFAYNLRTGATTDLGTLGGSASTATDISGSVVVGQSRTAGNGYAGYAYDLRTGVRTDLGSHLLTGELISGKVVVGGDSVLATTYDLTTDTTATVGPGKGVTQVNQILGTVMVGDNFAPNSLAFVARTENGEFTYLASLGGLNSYATQVNRQGVVAGSAALAPTEPFNANGPFHATVWVPDTQG